MTKPLSSSVILISVINIVLYVKYFQFRVWYSYDNQILSSLISYNAVVQPYTLPKKVDNQKSKGQGSRYTQPYTSQMKSFPYLPNTYNLNNSINRNFLG